MAAPTVRFGPFQMDLNAGLLRREGTPIPLRPKTWAVLCLLVENAGRLVSKNELLDRVWDGDVVSDTIAGISIAELRQALGDSTRQPKYIETVYRRGFRFIGVIEAEGAPTTPIAPKTFTASAGATDPGRVLVGRAAELARMRAFLSGDDGGRVMLLAGEAGIGKSSLLTACLTELAAVADGGGVAIGRGQCLPHFGQGYPYLSIIAALEDICRGDPHSGSVLRTHAPSWFARLHHAVTNEDPAAVPAAGSVAQRQLDPEELVAFVQALGPLVLAFEDLHWADHATFDFIVVMAQHPGLAQCRVFGTYRPAEAIATKHPILRARREMERHGRALELVLGGLDQAGVAAYLATRFSAAGCPDWLARDLLARSSGNPLFLSVTVDHLTNAGALELGADGQVSATERYAILSSEIPETLRELVLQRLAEHSERDQSLLASASVVGLEADAAAIAAACSEPVPVVDAACHTLARDSIFLARRGESLWPNGLLSGRYVFRHPLYQRVLYEELAPAVRLDAHRRIAATLIDAYGAHTIDIAAVIADHFDRGRIPSEAIDYHLMAARAAGERHASRDALVHLHRALDLQKATGDEEREAVILTRLATALPAVEGFSGPHFAASFARAHSLRAGNADVIEAVVTLAGLAVATLVQDNAVAAESLARELVRLASTRDDAAVRVPAGLVMGAVLYHQGDIPAACEYLDLDFGTEAAELSFGPLDLRTAWGALYTPILWQAGRPDEAVERATTAVARANSGIHPLNLVLALQAQTVAHHLSSHWERALSAAQRLRTMADEQGIHEVKSMAAMTEAAIQSTVGDKNAVVPLVESGIEACRTHGAVLTKAYVLAIGAEALVEIGQLSRAVALLDEAQASIAAGAARFWEPELHRLRGEVQLLASPSADRSEAEEHFAKARRIAAQQGSKSLSLRCALSWGQLLRTEGSDGQARHMVDSALRAIDGGSDSRDIIAAHIFLGSE